MRRIVSLLFVCLFVAYAMPCIAEEAPEAVDAAPVATQTVGTILSWAWAQLNTGAGMALIVGLWSWIIVKVFTKKPTWQKYYDQYKGHLIEAVKFAEKNIPDDTANKGAARLDMALKYFVKLQDIPTADTDHAAQALKVVHAEAQATEII